MYRCLPIVRTWRWSALVAVLTVGALSATEGCSADEAARVYGTSASGVGGLGGGGPSSQNSTTGGSGVVSIGKSCASDADCDDSALRCIRPQDDELRFATFYGEERPGGPAGGYCTEACELDDDCSGEGSICLLGAAGGICVLGCTFGEPADDAYDATIPEEKCHGRDDLACVRTNGGDEICMPVCGRDDACPPGRSCDLRSNLCVADPHEGLPIGAPCEQDNNATQRDEDGCAGRCEQVSRNGAVATSCSALCSFGGDPRTTHDCGGIDAGLCIFAPAGLSPGAGDYGFCTASCTSHDACNWTEGLFCFGLGLEANVGYCDFAKLCNDGTGECESGTSCVPTGRGPSCLEVIEETLVYPLGAAAAAEGGGGNGGSGGSGGA